MSLLCFLSLSIALAANPECETTPAGRDAVRAYRSSGDTSGFSFVWFDWRRCRAKIDLSDDEYAAMADREYARRRITVMNEADGADAAEAGLKELAELFPNKFDLETSRDRVIADAEARGVAKTRAINSPSRCETKDFTARLPPNWDQKNSNLCYAHAAAGAASFELGVEVSVADVVSSYLTPDVQRKVKAKFDASAPSFLKDARQRESEARVRRVSETGDLFDPSLSGGYPSVAFAEAAKVGFCRASAWRNQPAVSTDPLDVFALMNTLKSRFRQIETAADWAPFRKVFPHLTIEDYRRVAARSRPDTLVRDLGRVACKERLPLPLDVTTAQPKGPLNVAQTIQDQLLKNHVVPLGDAGHAFLVVGQRLNEDGLCVFKLRDTSGDGCRLYESFAGAIKGSCHAGYFEVAAIAPAGPSPLAYMVTVYTRQTERTRTSPAPTGSSR